ncbi:MAG: pseudouridine synthase [Myxococcota bacterium]
MIGEADLLFRDEILVALNKPSGLAVHRGDATDRVTALTEVRDLVGRWVYPVHRLDRGTSGALLFALDSQWVAPLQRQFNEQSIAKKYVALCRGTPKPTGLIDHPIPRSHRGPRVEAKTRFEVLAGVQGPLGRSYSWTELEPLTGRMHQLRRHLKHISHPIVGDVKYGDGRVNRAFRHELNLKRLALHAAELRFQHPVSGDAVALCADLPADLRQPLAALGLSPSVL